MDGTDESVELMARYAEIIWVSVPRDLGMFTGFSTTSRTYRADTEAVLHIMTSWAENAQGVWHLPLCLEDEMCRSCTNLLWDVVQ
jgi:hypothetical protein